MNKMSVLVLYIHEFFIDAIVTFYFMEIDNVIINAFPTAMTNGGLLTFYNLVLYWFYDSQSILFFSFLM